MDLKDGWEKKALIGLGVVVVLIIIYAYFVPFSGTPDNNTSYNQAVPAQVVPVPYSQPIINNSTSNSTSINGSYNLTSDQAKNIALNANHGYTVATITQGNIVINGTTYSVWIVAISQTNAPSKTVFVDAASGKILQTT